jgi:hypothetical protein
MGYLFFLLPFLLHAEITALYLSWYEDPTTSMTIQWHTPQDQFGDEIILRTTDGNWEERMGEHAVLEQVLIHKVSLKGLAPNTEYAFRLGGEAKIYRFRTAPDNLDEPLRFVIGGDVYSSTKLFRRMSQTVLEKDPHFVVLGGDIAYALVRSSPLRRWISFLKDWKDYMISADGKIIPFLIVPGSADISSDNYELFFSLFAFPQKQLYRAVDFGSYLSLILLDTGHFQPIEGRQTLWLDKALSSRATTPYRFAIYHEAAYPSFDPYHGVAAKKIRLHWTPLFEKYHLLAAFEHHNYAFKRTHPIKASQIDPAGVTYLGDGGWSLNPRKPNDLWYLAKSNRKNSVLMVEVSGSEARIQAIDLLGHSLDQVTIPCSDLH